MAQRGRKSTTSRKTLELTPMLPGQGRPEPPSGLSPDEARAWRDVVDSSPRLLARSRCPAHPAPAGHAGRDRRAQGAPDAPAAAAGELEPPTRTSRSWRDRMRRPQKGSPTS